jgi:hypothetical protein
MNPQPDSPHVTAAKQVLRAHVDRCTQCQAAMRNEDVPCNTALHINNAINKIIRHEQNEQEPHR